MFHRSQLFWKNMWDNSAHEQTEHFIILFRKECSQHSSRKPLFNFQYSKSKEREDQIRQLHDVFREISKRISFFVNSLKSAL